MKATQESRDDRYVQVGVIGIRDPKNRERIIENVPIYEEITDDHAARDVAACSDIALARMLADKYRQYINKNNGGTR